MSTKKQTHMQRAERWYNQQVKNGKLREADYSALSTRSALCYEPATMLNRVNDKTLHDILQVAKQLNGVTKFKL